MKPVLICTFCIGLLSIPWMIGFAASPYITNTTNASTLTDDSEMDENAATTKHGAFTTMDVGEDLSNNNKNLWLDCPSAFDSIPSGMIIDSLRIFLKITTSPFSDQQAVHMDIFSVSQTVVEADVTWDKYDATNDWTVGGGDGTEIQSLGLKLTHLSGFGSDSVAIANIADGSSMTDTVADQTTTKISFLVTKALAQDIYERNSAGLILKNDAATGAVSFSFAASENSTAADRPTWEWHFRAPPDYETNIDDAGAQIDDLFLDEDSPSSSRGSQTTARVGEVSAGNAYHYMIRDNLVADSLGANKIIDSCLVFLTLINNGTMDAQFDSSFFDFYECDQDWVESEATWDSAELDPGGVLWTTAGGEKTEIVTDYGTLAMTDAGGEF